MNVSIRSLSLGALALALALGALAVPAVAGSTFAGIWQITYYLDPTGAPGATECIVVNQKGHGQGVRTGKWFSPTLKGWHGDWVERGNHYAFHGFTSANTATYDVGDLINPNLAAETSAGVLTNTRGSITTVDTATATLVMVSSCTGARPHTGSNPFRGF